MSPLLNKLSFQGRVTGLFANPEREKGLEKEARQKLSLRFSGIAGDCHGGLTRASDSRMMKQYRKGTEVKNTRQVSLLSEEELAEIARRMGIAEIRPEWVGANIVTSGIPDLTLLPPSTRLQFPSGAMIVVDIENSPCRYAAEVIARHRPGERQGFVSAANGKRGIVGWVEREGEIAIADAITLWLPPQRTYAHA